MRLIWLHRMNTFVNSDRSFLLKSLYPFSIKMGCGKVCALPTVLSCYSSLLKVIQKLCSHGNKLRMSPKKFSFHIGWLSAGSLGRALDLSAGRARRESFLEGSITLDLVLNHHESQFPHLQNSEDDICPTSCTVFYEAQYTECSINLHSIDVLTLIFALTLNLALLSRLRVSF